MSTEEIIYDSIIMRCMSDPFYITQATWSEVGIKGFGSLITEKYRSQIKASLVNRKGKIVYEKFFPSIKYVSNAA